MTVAYAILLMLVPGHVLGYVNGGDFHHTLREYQEQLENEGWATSSSADGRVLRARPDPNPTAQLIAYAVQSLPAEQREAVTLEMKRGLAKIATDTFKVGQDKKSKRSPKGESVI